MNLIFHANGVDTMSEPKEKLLPGTTAAYIERGEKGFSKIAMLLEATGGLSLSQVCAVTGLEGSTIQNWVKRGWVAHPDGKKYEEVHIARVLIINALKECIKLEHIAVLMTYINGSGGSADGSIIKESELYNYLCDALVKMGSAADHSRGGIESVVEAVIRGYTGPRPDSRIRIRKALTLMIFACVCSDVKRRTESMMEQILCDIENPERIIEEVKKEAATTPSEFVYEEEPTPAEPSFIDEPMSADSAPKTVSQALREWDFSSVERVIIDPEREARAASAKAEEEEKTSNRPWYMRRK